MTRQTSQPIKGLRLSATTRQIRELVHLYQAGELYLDPPYQRGAVWTTDQQISLVRSWLMGVPIPALIVNDRRWAYGDPSRSVYAMIDGKQRVLAAYAWFSGELAVPASWFPAEDVSRTYDTDDGPYVRFADLDLAAQREFAFTATIPVAEARMGSDEASSTRMEAEVYLLVNGAGTPQTDEDLANAAQVAGEG